MRFPNRQAAGHYLAHLLQPYKGKKDAIVVGLARGGVVVAAVIAKELFLPLHVVVPRKIGAPGNKELAIGSIMENGEGVFNETLIDMLAVPPDYIKAEIAKEMAVAKKRLALYNQASLLEAIERKTVLLVDDGIATGYTMLGAVKVMQKSGAAEVLAIAPVASTEAADLLKGEADKVICPYITDDFMSVGMHYREFDQTEDQEVIEWIAACKK